MSDTVLININYNSDWPGSCRHDNNQYQENIYENENYVDEDQDDEKNLNDCENSFEDASNSIIFEAKSRTCYIKAPKVGHISAGHYSKNSPGVNEYLKRLEKRVVASHQNSRTSLVDRPLSPTVKSRSRSPSPGFNAKRTKSLTRITCLDCDDQQRSDQNSGYECVWKASRFRRLSFVDDPPYKKADELGKITYPVECQCGSENKLDYSVNLKECKKAKEEDHPSYENTFLQDNPPYNVNSWTEVDHKADILHRMHSKDPNQVQPTWKKEYPHCQYQLPVWRNNKSGRRNWNPTL